MCFSLDIIDCFLRAVAFSAPGLDVFIIFFAVFGTMVIVMLGSFLLLKDKLTGILEKKSGSGNEIKSMDNSENVHGLYEMLTDRIIKSNGNGSSVLFTSAQAESLPVTIPVNISLKLACEQRKCLLIDLDIKRNAVARAFSIIDMNTVPRPQKTDIENLYIWPAHCFERLHPGNLIFIVKAACEKYDYVLINAPALSENPDRLKIASAAKCCVIFTRNGRQASRLASMARTAKCSLIGNIQYHNGTQN